MPSQKRTPCLAELTIIASHMGRKAPTRAWAKIIPSLVFVVVVMSIVALTASRVMQSDKCTVVESTKEKVGIDALVASVSQIAIVSGDTSSPATTNTLPSLKAQNDASTLVSPASVKELPVAPPAIVQQLPPAPSDLELLNLVVHAATAYTSDILSNLNGHDLVSSAALGELSFKIAFIAGIRAQQLIHPGLMFWNEYQVGKSHRADIVIGFGLALLVVELKYVRLGYLRFEGVVTEFNNAAQMMDFALRVESLFHHEVLSLKSQVYGNPVPQSIAAQSSKWASQVQLYRQHMLIQLNAPDDAITTRVVYGVGRRALVL